MLFGTKQNLCIKINDNVYKTETAESDTGDQE